jgi:hypothetical protein
VIFAGETKLASEKEKPAEGCGVEFFFEQEAKNRHSAIPVIQIEFFMEELHLRFIHKVYTILFTDITNSVANADHFFAKADTSRRFNALINVS